MSPRLPAHSRSNTDCSYGSLPTFNAANGTAPNIFHESFIHKYSPALEAFNGSNIEARIAAPTRNPRLLHRISRKLLRLMNDWWLLELISWAIGAICVVAIAAVMATFNGHPLPSRWPGGITLNAYISILAGAAKVMMAVPLEAALGQLKWLWFRSKTPRQLLDLERFDNAARGAWGAAALLLSGSGR